MNPPEPASPTVLRPGVAVAVVLAVAAAILARRVEPHGLDLA